MDVKDKVYISLQECLNESEKIPTSQIADNLHLSRQIVTHYLNQLFDEGKVKKQIQDRLTGISKKKNRMHLLKKS